MIEEHRLLSGRYRLQHSLGRGGMADVYLAFDERRQARVAVKILREDMAEDPELARHFRQEAELLSRLDHPNIVHFYAFEQDGPLAYIVMDFIDGTTLRWRLFDRKGPLPLDEMTRIVGDLSAALHYAHLNGCIHRDLKPGNVMLQRDGKSLLTDFGIAHALESVTVTGPLTGTPAYMSPEQIDSDALDARADVYSFGALMFEMATGRRPFTGEEAGLTTQGNTSHRLREAHLSLTPPNPRNFNPALPAAAASVILRCLAKRPADRWPDMLSLRRAWDAAMGPAAAGALPVNPELEALAQAEKSARSRRSPLFWILPAVLILAVVVIAAVLALAARQTPPGGVSDAQTPPASTSAVAALTVGSAGQPAAPATRAPRSTGTGGVQVAAGGPGAAAAPTTQREATAGPPAPTLAPIPTAAGAASAGGNEPTVAPTFTAEMAPTAAPTFTSVPSPTVAAAPTPRPTTPPRPTAAPTAPPAVSGGVTLLVPPEGDRIYGESAFVWEDEPGFQLGPGELYELIVWGPNENALQGGRSPVGAGPFKAVDVNLTAVEGALGLTPGQQYSWGVRLLANGAPKRMLSGGRSFIYERAGGEGTVSTDPGCVGDGCQK